MIIDIRDRVRRDPTMVWKLKDEDGKIHQPVLNNNGLWIPILNGKKIYYQLIPNEILEEIRNGQKNSDKDS